MWERVLMICMFEQEVVFSGAAAETQGMLKRVVMASVGLHEAVVSQSARFYEELKRHNHVTPTSYLEQLSTFKGGSPHSPLSNLHQSCSVCLWYTS